MNLNFSTRIIKWLLGLALLSFFIGIGLPYIGEEGVYTISSYEMWYYKQFFYPTLLHIAILAKYLWLIFLVYYQHNFRGDYKQVAQQILLKSHPFPLYSNDIVATGLSVTAHIDNLRYSHPPLQHTDFAQEKAYFLISDKLNAKLGKYYATFFIGKQGTPIYLLCQGIACNLK
jgi:hypothetical protein